MATNDGGTPGGSQVAWISVTLEDDYPREYPRPSVLEISAACTELCQLDVDGLLPEGVEAAVRVLLAAVGRMSATGMAEAFPQPAAPAPARPALCVVETGDDQ